MGVIHGTRLNIYMNEVKIILLFLKLLNFKSVHQLHNVNTEKSM